MRKYKKRWTCGGGGNDGSTKYTVPARHTSIIILEYEEGPKILPTIANAWTDLAEWAPRLLRLTQFWVPLVFRPDVENGLCAYLTCVWATSMLPPHSILGSGPTHNIYGKLLLPLPACHQPASYIALVCRRSFLALCRALPFAAPCAIAIATARLTSFCPQPI